MNGYLYSLSVAGKIEIPVGINNNVGKNSNWNISKFRPDSKIPGGIHEFSHGQIF
jgi:hypothetical protein